MSYVDGFVIPIPVKNIEAYRAIAEKAGAMWKKHGALSYFECVGEDMDDHGFGLPFTRIAPDLKEDETVVFSFIVYESREHRDEVNAKVMADPAMKEMADQNIAVFDCDRMAYSGFKTIVQY